MVEGPPSPGPFAPGPDANGDSNVDDIAGFAGRFAVQTEIKQVQHSEQRAETETENLAAVLGPTLMALTASEALNYHIWDTQFPAVTYLNGLVIFAAGVAILRKEHRWTRRWPVTVTILGWIATLGGFTRMFWPEAQQPAKSAGLYAFLTAGFLAGGFLTYKAYWHRIKN